MIEITRALAKRLRAVLSKAAPAHAGRTPKPPLLFEAGPEGLRVRSIDTEVAIEYHQPGSFEPDHLILPAAALADLEGSKPVPVRLEQVRPNVVQARCEDRGGPLVREYETVAATDPTPFPALPERWTAQEQAFLAALHEAANCTAQEGIRYALQKVQLRGGTGQIVATDGRHLLIQNGFAFPWKDSVLMPTIGAFGCKEVKQATAVSIGLTPTHVGIQVGPWNFLLTIDRESRFPRVEDVIPAPHSTITTCRLSPSDAEFLARALPRLPSTDEDMITLDLNGSVAVRAKGEDQSQPTEVLLPHSIVDGPALRFCTGRRYLAHALALGFTEIQLRTADKPVVCRDDQRTYLWMPVGQVGALPPSEAAIRITAPEPPSTIQPRRPERREEHPPTPATTGTANGHTNGHTNGSGDGLGHPSLIDGLPLDPADDSSSGPSRTIHSPSRVESPAAEAPHTNGTSSGSLIKEVEQLKDVLRDAYTRVNGLLISLKRQRKQSQLLKSTLASLRQLQQIEQ